MTFYLKSSRKNSGLSLPSGVLTLSEMKAEVCKKNAMQSVRVENNPALEVASRLFSQPSQAPPV